MSIIQRYWKVQIVRVLIYFIYIRDSPKAGYTILVCNKAQNTNPETPCPILRDLCVGSLTSLRVMNIEGL